MPTGLVLDPTWQATPAPAPEGGVRTIRSLEGQRIGIRLDERWRSWDWVADEWALALPGRGAEVEQWRAGTRVGDRAEKMDIGLSEFVEQIDLGVFGLGNCGGCTMETVRDALAAQERGIPSVVICTEQYESLARGLAVAAGTGVTTVVLPFPLENRPEEEVREIARQHLDAMVTALLEDQSR